MKIKIFIFEAEKVTNENICATRINRVFRMLEEER